MKVLVGCEESKPPGTSENNFCGIGKFVNLAMDLIRVQRVKL
jgi:hypothetical protein